MTQNAVLLRNVTERKLEVERTKLNARAKVEAEIARVVADYEEAVVAAREDGFGGTAIARAAGVTPPTIYGILSRAWPTWREETRRGEADRLQAILDDEHADRTNFRAQDDGYAFDWKLGGEKHTFFILANHNGFKFLGADGEPDTAFTQEFNTGVHGDVETLLNESMEWIRSLDNEDARRYLESIPTDDKED